MKTCTKCKQEKPLEAFGVNNQQTSGLQPACKECHNAYGVIRRGRTIENIPVYLTCTICKISQASSDFPVDRSAKYGRRPSCKKCEAPRKRNQYLEKRIAKKDTSPVPRGCEICGCKFFLEAKKGEKDKNTPHWDHIHETETFRGWLCHNCNSALGQFGENIKIVARALEYMNTRGAVPTRPLIK